MAGEASSGGTSLPTPPAVEPENDSVVDYSPPVMADLVQDLPFPPRQKSTPVSPHYTPPPGPTSGLPFEALAMTNHPTSTAETTRKISLLSPDQFQRSPNLSVRPDLVEKINLAGAAAANGGGGSYGAVGGGYSRAFLMELQSNPLSLKKPAIDNIYWRSIPTPHLDTDVSMNQSARSSAPDSSWTRR